MGPEQLLKVWGFASRVCLAGSLFATSFVGALAQNVPIVSGGIGWLDSTNAGVHFFQPVVAPAVAIPIGDRLLVEARFDFRRFYERQNGKTGAIQGTSFNSTQYLQLDYIANRRLTFTAGRFLTPFGTYNERLTPIWIQKFQDAPMVYAIGTRTTGSSDGAMLRGVLFSRPQVQVSYVGYFSTTSSVGQFQSARSAGDRIDVYFPSHRVEIGTSYGRFLQGTHNNSFGGHFWWQPPGSPLEVRSEYAHGEHAQGYWLEASYPLTQAGGPRTLLSHIEPLFRLQQVFRNSPGHGDGLPTVDTKQFDFGLQLHLPHEVRLSSSYSRKLSTATDANIWDLSLTYRFLMPLWREGK